MDTPKESPLQIVETYANNTNVSIGAWDIDILFSALSPGSEQPHQSVRVRLSHQMGLALASLLINSLAQYKKQTGLGVELPKEQLDHMGSGDAVAAISAFIESKMKK